MKIKEIRINGFRNVKDCTLELQEITGLLSANSYGKSNVLDAINFGIDFINKSSSVKDNMFGWKIGLPKNKNFLSDTFSFELTLLQEYEKKEYEVVYGYTFLWRFNEKSKAKVISEILKFKELKSKQTFSRYISRDEEKSLYRSGVSGRCDKKIKIGDDELIVNKLVAFDNLFYYSIIKEINDLVVYVDKHLDSTSAFDMDPIVRKGTDDLKLATEANIPRTLFKLKEVYPDKYNYLVESYCSLFPKIENIEVKAVEFNVDADVAKIPEDFQLTDRIYFLLCKEFNMRQEINFLQMSDGARRILLLLTNLILAEINKVPLFCVEEPENSVNPELFRKYIEIIDDLKGDTKILLTSHSPYLINFLNPECLYIGCFNAEDIIEFFSLNKSATKKLYKDAAKYNLSYADYILELTYNKNFYDEDIKKYVKS